VNHNAIPLASDFFNSLPSDFEDAVVLKMIGEVDEGLLKSGNLDLNTELILRPNTKRQRRRTVANRGPGC
jgi:hypothetical protein